MERGSIQQVNKVTDARVRAGLTQPDLARLAGVSVFTVKRAERGVRIGLLSRQRIVNALGAKLGVSLVRSDFWPEEVAS
jgi:DNA-binding XRE family transcriptional regulator